MWLTKALPSDFRLKSGTACTINTESTQLRSPFTASVASLRVFLMPMSPRVLKVTCCTNVPGGTLIRRNYLTKLATEFKWAYALFRSHSFSYIRHWIKTRYSSRMSLQTLTFLLLAMEARIITWWKEDVASTNTEIRCPVFSNPAAYSEGRGFYF